MAKSTMPEVRHHEVCLLLDAYGSLLTERQLTFLRHYYEEDLTFGEIATDYGVSRQAVFDAVKHGAEGLEQFEEALGLVGSGWSAWEAVAQTPQGISRSLGKICERIEDRSDQVDVRVILRELKVVVRSLEPESGVD